MKQPDARRAIGAAIGLAAVAQDGRGRRWVRTRLEATLLEQGDSPAIAAATAQACVEIGAALRRAVAGRVTIR